MMFYGFLYSLLVEMTLLQLSESFTSDDISLSLAISIFMIIIYHMFYTSILFS